MDEYTLGHLKSWLGHALLPEEWKVAERKIRLTLVEHPDLLERGWSWRQVLDLGAK